MKDRSQFKYAAICSILSEYYIIMFFKLFFNDKALKDLLFVSNQVTQYFST